jgi:hypothetical protein
MAIGPGRAENAGAGAHSATPGRRNSTRVVYMSDWSKEMLLDLHSRLDFFFSVASVLDGNVEDAATPRPALVELVLGWIPDNLHRGSI